VKSPHAVYGLPPADLASVAADAVQCSPIIPDSAALEDMADASLASLTMLAPPGTLERRYAMAHGLRALAVGAPFTILAPRDKGGARLAGELEQFACAASDDSKRHHRICTGLRPETLTGIADAITEGAPRFMPEIDGWTQPGLFSWNRVDAGSALLTTHLPQLQGTGADLGCGIGYLARTILTSPRVTHLTLIDIDRRAVAMAQKNIDTAHTTTLWADIRTLTLRELDFIVSNPPFHEGGVEDQTLGQQFIQRAAAMLRAGGVLWLVANRHLPYEAIMKPLFHTITPHAERDGFKIYEAVK